MQRKIKFRGKEIDTGKRVYGYYFKDFNGKSYIINTLQEIQTADTSNVWIEVLGDTVGQYTGLKDKNGKEIYEGDIVWQFDIKENGIIEYKYGQFGIKCLGMFWNIHPTKLEAIGNIHDNPELLKEG